MILNVSGRTDIVAFYMSWFKKRYEEGFVDVRNPFYKKQVSRIYFKDVDMIVFCTKNPGPIRDYLGEIKEPIFFNVTITPYKKDIEPNVPDKREVIRDVKIIAGILGRERVIVRYDPIFLSEKYNIYYHIKAFRKLCSSLEGSVGKIIVSFIDNYKNVQKNINVLKIKNFTEDDFRELGWAFSEIARSYGMVVQTCGEYRNLEECGFAVGDCVSKEIAKEMTGKNFPKWKSRNSKYCNCVEMVDIGEYNTCNHLCKYCYANFLEEEIKKNRMLHNPNSTMLIGEIRVDDEIKIRKK